MTQGLSGESAHDETRTTGGREPSLSTPELAHVCAT